MPQYTLRIIIAAILLLATILSGFWLRKAGLPYPVFMSTIHKLASLVMALFFVLFYISATKIITADTFIFKLALVSGGLFVISLASGALLTNEKTFSSFIQIAHRVVALIFILSIIVLTITSYKKLLG